MTFEKLPAVPGRAACLNCGTPHDSLPMNAPIAVGFGSAHYAKDGVCLWDEQQHIDGEDYPTAQTVEDLAKADPDHDWRIAFYGPMWEGEYQRQGDGHWVLVSQGQGFA